MSQLQASFQQNQQNYDESQFQSPSMRKQQEEKRPEEVPKTKEEAKKALKGQIELAKKFIIEGLSTKALDIIKNAIKDLKDLLGGEHSILLIPGYIVLAEANLQEKRLEKAEQFLNIAKWNFLRGSDDKKDMDQQKVNPEITNEERLEYEGQMHKTFSKLYLAERDYPRALQELQDAVYMDSVKYGPEEIETSSSYFQMGNIFLSKKSVTETDAFYGKYSHIWYKNIKKRFQTVNDPLSENPISELLIKEAISNLSQIQSYFESIQQAALNEGKAQMITALCQQAKTYYALAYLYKYRREEDYAREFLQKVLEIYVKIYGANSRKCMKISGFINGEDEEEMMQQQQQMDSMSQAIQQQSQF